MSLRLTVSCLHCTCMLKHSACEHAVSVNTDYFPPQWLEGEFLSYLDDWEESVHGRTDIEKEDKDQLMISRETRTGLRMTGWYHKFRIMAHICIVLCTSIAFSCKCKWWK